MATAGAVNGLGMMVGAASAITGSIPFKYIDTIGQTRIRQADIVGSPLLRYVQDIVSTIIGRQRAEPEGQESVVWGARPLS